MAAHHSISVNTWKFTETAFYRHTGIVWDIEALCSQIDQINSYTAKGEAAVGTAQRAAAVSQSMAFSENQVPKIDKKSLIVANGKHLPVLSIATEALRPRWQIKAPKHKKNPTTPKKSAKSESVLALAAAW